MSKSFQTTIRPFISPEDNSALRQCVVELQDFERVLDPRMPPGKEIVDDYVAGMKAKCLESEGAILVSETDGEISGYVLVLTRVRSGELDDGNIEYGLVDDIVVREKYRGLSVGKKLLNAAEDHARSKSVRWLRLCVLASNTEARSLYTTAGFSELYIDFEKDLGD